MLLSNKIEGLRPSISAVELASRAKFPNVDYYDPSFAEVRVQL